jgi:hypothetical protein
MLGETIVHAQDIRLPLGIRGARPAVDIEWLLVSRFLDGRRISGF